MSAEESKIRDELEMEVERDLEAEIKDEIYHLALRLHRLYQHQKQRKNTTQQSKLGKKNQHAAPIKKSTTTLSAEVNINIKMDGGTKIEIKEVKKEAPKSDQSKAMSKLGNMQGMVGSRAKKFDWAKSLRSESPIVVNNFKKNESPHHGKSIRYEHGFLQNHKLQMGWKV